MADRIVFHFNKASLGRADIPPWVVKSRGLTHYAWHVESEIGFSTKESPDSGHTQGSVQFRGKLALREVAGRLHAYVIKENP